MPAQVSAEGTTITQGSKDKSGSVNIDYYADVSYEVTIPASVTFTDTDTTIERGLQVRNVMLNEGTSLNINVTSRNDFKMIYKDGSIDYSLIINKHARPEKNNFNILTVAAGERSGIATLDFVSDLAKAEAKFAGKYTDTLTFTVSID